MKISDLKPCSALRPYISRYWLWDGERVLPTMLPGTGAELMFHFADTPWVQPQNGPLQRLPRSVLLSPRSGRMILTVEAPVTFLSVRFRSGSLRHFCRVPTGDLIDRCWSAPDLWGQAGQKVESQIGDTRSLSGRITIIEKFLLEQLQACSTSVSAHNWLTRAFRQLYYRPGAGLDVVVAHSGVGVRQFQKVFKRYAGVSPKYYQRIARMEHSVRRLLLEQSRHYLDVALDQGFYDQAHFIRDFRELTGEIPSRFLCDRNFSTHFYNPSLRY